MTKWMTTTVLLALLATSCRQIGQPLPLDFPQQRQERTLRRIAFLRGLELDRAVPVETLDEKHFFERLHHITETNRVRFPAPTAGDSHGDNLRIGLQLLGARTEPVDEATLPAKRVAAAYDAGRQTVILRASHSLEGNEPAENVLAHELFHAVQHRHFGLADYTATSGLDEALALKAFYEGDASLVGVAAEYQRSGFSWKALVAKLSRIVQRKPMQAAIHASLYAPRPGQHPSTDKIEALFFYMYGLVFVHDLYLAGGFDLVNAAYRHPPRSTEQVLHPGAYLEGDLPVIIGPLPVPDGLEPVAVGGLGELMLRGVVSSCTGWETACTATAGWGGDRFLVVGDEAGRRALLWAVAWDSAEAARRFEKLLDELAECWLDTDDSGSLRLIDDHLAVRRQGKLVVVARGLPAGDCPTVLDGLATVSIEVPPPAPPPALRKRRSPLPENRALPAGRLQPESP